MTKDPFDTLWINTKADREPFLCSSVIFFPFWWPFAFFFTSLSDLVRFKNIMLEKSSLHTHVHGRMCTYILAHTKTIDSMPKCLIKIKNRNVAGEEIQMPLIKWSFFLLIKREKLENNRPTQTAIYITEYSLIKPDQFSYQVIPGYSQFSNSATC